LLSSMDMNAPFVLGGGMETGSVAFTIPESVFMMFQMTFAIITPALITGAFVDRMKFSSLLVFTVLWVIVVYAPIAHWVWHPMGVLWGLGVLDFAGGTVVHINAGVAGLVTAIIIGKRAGYGSGGPVMDVCRMVAAWQAKRAGPDFRRGCGAGGDHPGLGLC